MKTLSGQIVDILNERIYPGTIAVEDGRIVALREDSAARGAYIMPGFIDSHVHVESSMLVPSEFVRLAVTHGTVATVSDPHEIANVLGVDGVRFMMENGRAAPFKFYFGVPSCVPATSFETAGAVIDAARVDELLADGELRYLSEMMDYPGVLARKPDVMAKIAAAARRGKPVDGHAPGLRGDDLRRYIAAGMTTDHESTSREEALEKLSAGMKILIREDSAARNFEMLAPLIEDHAGACMLCTDDAHPDGLVDEHIDELVRGAVRLGIDTMKVLRCACVNPVFHYRLDVGLLREGDPADFIEVDDLEHFGVLRTYVDGRLVAENGRSLIESVEVAAPNNFQAQRPALVDVAVAAHPRMNVIEAGEGELLTGWTVESPKVEGGLAVTDVERDLLKIAVINRYRPEVPAIGFVRNFGLRGGALASSVAHDSHNIVVVGAGDAEMARAAGLVVENGGGLAVVCGEIGKVLPLPVAGIMSNRDGFEVARQYAKLHNLSLALGSSLRDPLLTLSFMALPVIPKLKITDRGLFDVERFRPVGLFEVP